MNNEDRLKKALHYNPDTGVFIWINNNNSRVNAGMIAGSLNGSGYQIISIDAKRYYSHRLAWLYVYGELPSCQIDHINGIRTDNRIINLREATNAKNQQNLKKCRANNKIGLLGVDYFKYSKKKYRAQIMIDSKQKCLGYFETPEEAHEAYLDAKRKFHEFCTL